MCVLDCSRHRGRRTRRGVRGEADPPVSKISGHTLFFRASASHSKILNVKIIFNTVKIFRAHSVFQGKRKLLKTLECKKYKFKAVISGQLCFSGQAQSCSKILNGEKYIQYSEKFEKKKR